MQVGELVVIDDGKNIPERKGEIVCIEQVGAGFHDIVHVRLTSGQVEQHYKPYVKVIPRLGPFQVVFEYHEESRKWDIIVKGAKDSTEARQGFAAVVLSCQQLNPEWLNMAIITPDFHVTPAV